MVAYNFQRQFADKVASGEKSQTIRAERRDGRHAKVGDRLQLYTGMRTKACRKLRDPDPVCVVSRRIEIHDDRIVLHVDGRTVNGRSSVATESMARADGFADFNAMKDWFRQTHGLPFTGRLIAWAGGDQPTPEPERN